MTAPDGSTNYLPCDEQHATRWWVKNVATERGLLFEDRDAAIQFMTDPLAIDWVESADDREDHQ